MSIKKLVINSDNLNTFTKIGEGSNSIVYKHPYESKVLKLFKKTDVFDEELIKRIVLKSIDYSDLLDSCDVIFPKELVICSDSKCDRVVGYSTDLINGLDLIGLRDSSYFFQDKEFYSLACKFYENARLLTSNRICIMDLNAKNIMYDFDNDRFVFIDIDAWSYDREFDTIFDEDRNVRTLDKILNSYRRECQKRR